MEFLIMFAPLLIAIAILVAWIMAISLFIDAIKLKGHFKDKGTGLLWFVGFFATPLVIGLYAAALPEKKSTTAKAHTEELPAI